MSIISALRTHAADRPDALFCSMQIKGSVSDITFKNLLERSEAYGRYLLDAGIGAGDVVVIILQHSPHLFYSYLGAMLIGAVPTFMPFPSSKQRADIYWHDHDSLFKKIEPSIIITYAENARAAHSTLDAFDIQMLIADDAILETSGARLTYAPTSRSIACLQHSSGTTGLKKGVMLTHEAIATEVLSYARALDFTSRDIIASWLPLYHDMGFVACFMAPLICGAHVVSLDPFEWVMRPSILLDAIERYGAQFTWLPNFAFSHLVNGSRKSASWDLSSMRAFINCSEPCKMSTFDRFLDRFSDCGISREKLQVCYAMAENVFGVTQTQMGDSVRAFPAAADDLALGQARKAMSGERAVPIPSCGVPLEGVEIRIVDGTAAALPPGCVGEISLRSPFMFDGYYRLPEKTSERLRDGWYYTGDMGFMDGGELFVTGRKDDMIIVNGRNYYAHEIERLTSEVTGALPGRNVAIGLDESLTDSTVIVVLVECADGTDVAALAQGVRKAILETTGLALHAVIPLRKGELVKTTSGKISRTKNKEIYEAGGFTALEGA